MVDYRRPEMSGVLPDMRWAVIPRNHAWQYREMPWWRGGGYRVYYNNEYVAWFKYPSSRDGFLFYMQQFTPDEDWVAYARPG